jgi:hypothetical protein
MILPKSVIGVIGAEIPSGNASSSICRGITGPIYANAQPPVPITSRSRPAAI